MRVQALEEKPELDMRYFFIWDMWNILHRTRQVGGGATPLPFSEAFCWMDMFCPSYTLDEREFILSVFLAMEDTWLTWARKEQDKK